MNDFFFEIFDAKLPRLGPGLRSVTIDTFNKLPIQNTDLKVLEVGCGNGAQTITLAGIVNGTITAVDFHPQFLEELKLRANANGYDNKIIIKHGDMNNLDLPEEAFDIIWCEGAIFIMGFEKGLAELKKFLKPGGFMVLSDMVYFSADIPGELSEFFDMVHADCKISDEIVEMIKQNGYKLLDNFKLSNEGWAEYHNPIIPYLEKFESKYAGNDEALAVSKIIRQEIEMIRKYKDNYGYMFFVMQKPLI